MLAPLSPRRAAFVLATLTLAASLPGAADAQRAVAPRLTLRAAPIEGRTESPVVTGVALSPDGATIAAAGDDHTVRLWRSADGSPVATLAGHTDWARCVAFSPDGSMIAAASSDRSIGRWAARGGGWAALSPIASPGALLSLAFHPNGQQLVTVGFGCPLYVVNLSSGDAVEQYGCAGGDADAVAVSRDGRWMAAAGRSGVVRVWDLEVGSASVDLPTDGRRVRSLAFSPSSGMLAAGGDGPAVRLWRLDAGASLLGGAAAAWSDELLTRPGKTHALAFVGDNLLAVGGTGDRIVLHELVSHSAEAALEGHTGTVASLAVSEDGTTLVSGSFDTTVRVWDLGAAQTATGNRPTIQR